MSCGSNSTASTLSGAVRTKPRDLSARAIVNDPLLILADEPTGALDSRTGLAILALFHELNRTRRAIVLVTHDPRVAQQAGRIVTLHDGRLIGDASLDETA
jgi:putative ABC transport system ATP-binding protein